MKCTSDHGGEALDSIIYHLLTLVFVSTHGVSMLNEVHVNVNRSERFYKV